MQDGYYWQLAPQLVSNKYNHLVDPWPLLPRWHRRHVPLNLGLSPCDFLLSFLALLEERLESVYKVDERYSDKAASLFTLDLGAPEVSVVLGVGRPPTGNLLTSGNL